MSKYASVFITQTSTTIQFPAENVLLRKYTQPWYDDGFSKALDMTKANYKRNFNTVFDWSDHVYYTVPLIYVGHAKEKERDFGGKLAWNFTNVRPI